MGRLKQMNRFMDHDILQTFGRIFGQLRIQTNAFGDRITTPPFGPHALHMQLLRFHARVYGPFRNQRLYRQPDLIPVPFFQDGTPLVLRSAGTKPPGRTSSTAHRFPLRSSNRRAISGKGWTSILKNDWVPATTTICRLDLIRVPEAESKWRTRPPLQSGSSGIGCRAFGW